MTRVVVVHPDLESAQQLSKALSAELSGAEVTVWSESYSGDVDYAAGWMPPPDFFSKQPRLKAFFSLWAGVEAILGNPHLPASLPVIRLEDAGMGAQMADYCVGETLRWLRRCEEYTAQQRARVWQHLPGNDKEAWSIGVFGLGVLGRRIASAFISLGFRVNAYTRNVHQDTRIKCFSEAVGPDDFAAFMRATRVLILVAPLTQQTENRFDRFALSLLPRSSYVINVARGNLVVDEALIELLDSGHLAGATLDVFKQEPLPADHPFWVHPQVRVTPHVAAVTLFAPAARQIATKILRLTDNEPVSGVVDRARGY